MTNAQTAISALRNIERSILEMMTLEKPDLASSDADRVYTECLQEAKDLIRVAMLAVHKNEKDAA